MAPPRKDTTTDPVAAKLDEVARLLAILVARDRSLQDAVADLSAVGFGPKRIGELIGTSPGYVKVAADRAKKRKAAGKKAGGTAEE
jgi:DNA-directed RNA polymerase specialized sigma24 family protein